MLKSSSNRSNRIFRGQKPMSTPSYLKTTFCLLNRALTGSFPTKLISVDANRSFLHQRLRSTTLWLLFHVAVLLFWIFSLVSLALLLRNRVSTVQWRKLCWPGIIAPFFYSIFRVSIESKVSWENLFFLILSKAQSAKKMSSWVSGILVWSENDTNHSKNL